MGIKEVKILMICAMEAQTFALIMGWMLGVLNLTRSRRELECGRRPEGVVFIVRWRCCFGTVEDKMAGLDTVIRAHDYCVDLG